MGEYPRSRVLRCTRVSVRRHRSLASSRAVVLAWWASTIRHANGFPSKMSQETSPRRRDPTRTPARMARRERSASGISSSKQRSAQVRQCHGNRDTTLAERAERNLDTLTGQSAIIKTSQRRIRHSIAAALRPRDITETASCHLPRPPLEPHPPLRPSPWTRRSCPRVSH